MEAEKENISVAVGTEKATAMDEETLKMMNGGGLPASSRNGDNSSGHQEETLQQRFARFRKERQRERKLAKFVAQPRMNADKQSGLERSKEFRDGLRAKFVSTAKKYLGVPYAASYHPTPDCEHYNAPLYLDCCGLVRRSLQDLAGDFGFKVGRWNQNYQFDTLNHETNPPLSFEQLRPGDLVFVEGRYFNERAKRQKYDLVHVEIFLGASEGPGLENSTIGARHQRGVCCVHPSYKYTSKSYEILKYHFRSIEPWLRGELQPTHPEDWKSRDKDIAGGTFNVVDAAGKRSIFDDEASEDEEGAGDLNADTELEAGQTKLKSASEGNSATDGRPIFYVEKGNGWKLVSAAMEKFGWARLPFEYGFRTSFDLKWVQLRSQIDYVAHKEGQLVNHIPNNTVLTSKIGLLETLREYFPEEHFPPKWFPESFRLDLPSDGLRLLARHDDLLAKKQKIESETNGKADDIIWILKPSSANCGRGIILVSDAAELRKSCFPDAVPPAPPTSLPNEPEANDRVGTEAKIGTTTTLAEVAGQCQLGAELPDEQHCSNGKSKSGPRTPTLTAGIAQRYLARPLLLQGRKFDIRMYILIARASKGQMLAYVHHGYARLSLEKYSLDSLDDRFVHLTVSSFWSLFSGYLYLWRSLNTKRSYYFLLWRGGHIRMLQYRKSIPSMQRSMKTRYGAAKDWRRYSLKKADVSLVGPRDAMADCKWQRSESRSIAY